MMALLGHIDLARAVRPGPSLTPTRERLAMSKRLNPHRRLLAAQARALNEQRLVQSAVEGADMAKLQQGRVRSHMSRGNPTSATFREPNWTDPDNPGRKPRKSQPRFGVK